MLLSATETQEVRSKDTAALLWPCLGMTAVLRASRGFSLIPLLLESSGGQTGWAPSLPPITKASASAAESKWEGWICPTSGPRGRKKVLGPQVRPSLCYPECLSVGSNSVVSTETA